MIEKGFFIAPLVLTIACGSATAPPEPKTSESASASASAKVEKAKVAHPPGETEKLAEAEAAPPERSLGDYFVYRYSGRFADEPLTLTEQVVAQEFGLWVVDFVLEQGDDMTALRVRMNPAGRILSVAHLGPDGELPANLEDYDAMMARTQLVPDRNQDQIGTEDTTCLVGQDEEIDCTTTSYLVEMGDKEAVLSVTKSEAVPGRDVSGEILGPSGDVLYRAELVDRGNQEPGANAVAWAGKSLRFSPPEP